MKKIILGGFCFFLLGCVSTLATKEVEVHKDANGKIIEIVERESATQRGTMMPFAFEHLKRLEGDDEPAKMFQQN